MAYELNILAIGGSRNIGYFSAVRFLASGSTVTFLLRSPSVFDKDEVIQGYVRSGSAHLLKGDALVRSDVQHAWDEAAKRGNVDLLLFTVGGAPSFHLLKGFVISPANLVTQSLLNALCTMPRTSPQPRIITLSVMGATRTSHAALPLPVKLLYKSITVPHKDKIGSERIISHCAGWTWDTKNDGEPDESIMGPDWLNREGLPAAGSLNQVLVIRPALLTDGECVAEKDNAGGKEGKSKEAYRVSEADLRGWTISRKDVAHFVVDAVLHRWDQFKNKRVSIVY